MKVCWVCGEKKGWIRVLGDYACFWCALWLIRREIKNYLKRPVCWIRGHQYKRIFDNNNWSAYYCVRCTKVKVIRKEENNG